MVLRITITIFTINGKSQRVDEFEDQDSVSISKLLIHLKINPETVAVEVDRQVIDRENWDMFLIDSKNQIEIMKFVGGG